MKKFAKTWWGIGDVCDVYEQVFKVDCPWSDERCEAFLQKHIDAVIDAMVGVGWDVLENFMYEEKD